MRCSEPDDCVIVGEFSSTDDIHWICPRSETFFSRVDFDVDSVVIVGSSDLTWLCPPWEFECRLDVVHATLAEDKKVWID